MVYNQKIIALIKSQGSILRKYDGSIVQLPFGSEYSILLKNLSTKDMVANITVDGRTVISDLIVRRNDIVEVERFFEESMESGHKLKFIEKTDDIREYRGNRLDDGIVRVEYRFVKKQPEPYFLEKRCAPTTIPFFRRLCTSNIPDYTYIDMYCSQCSQPRKASVNEDGITVEGKYSDQKFVYGTVGELENESHSIVIRLKGETQCHKVSKSLEVNTKLRCQYCGKSWKSNHKFCGNCGAALI